MAVERGDTNLDVRDFSVEVPRHALCSFDLHPTYGSEGSAEKFYTVHSQSGRSSRNDVSSWVKKVPGPVVPRYRLKR